MKAQYIDHMGDDLAIVNAAKVSFGKRSEWAEVPHWVNTKFGCDEYEGDYVLSKKDQGLIQFLARGCTSGDWDQIETDIIEMGIDQLCVDDDPRVAEISRENLRDLLNHVRRMPSHWSPFAHTAISLHLKMPIFVARQIMKHTTGIEYNEVSRRYVDSEPEFYVPDVWRKKADNVKQGSSDEVVDVGFGKSFNPESLYSLVLQVYKQCVDVDGYNMAPEQARMILPQSMYTEVIATGNLYAWANLYVQRTDSHAQKETQDLAKQIGEIIQPLYPVSWEALCGGIQNHLNEVERLAK